MGIVHEERFPGGICPVTNCRGGELSQGKLSRLGIVQVEISLGGCPGPVQMSWNLKLGKSSVAKRLKWEAKQNSTNFAKKTSESLRDPK